jgi:hypothetical protein
VTKTCLELGCDRQAYSRSLCRLHYKRLLQRRVKASPSEGEPEAAESSSRGSAVQEWARDKKLRAKCLATPPKKFVRKYPRCPKRATGNHNFKNGVCADCKYVQPGSASLRGAIEHPALAADYPKWEYSGDEQTLIATYGGGQ